MVQRQQHSLQSKKKIISNECLLEKGFSTKILEIFEIYHSKFENIAQHFQVSIFFHPFHSEL